MKSLKSATLGLAFGAIAFGLAGCKDTVNVPPTPPPALTISLTPQNITLNVGETAQLAAAVSGGAEGTAHTVTFSSANSSIASVSASGVVTAVAAGTTTITATATADANVQAAAAVTVTEQGGGGQVPPSISIKSITTGATNVPVQLNNVFGQIDITLNLTVPQGAQVSKVALLVDNTEVASQTFSGGAAASDQVEGAADELVFSLGTNSYDMTTGAATWANGPHAFTAQVVGPDGTITASTSVQVTFNNINFVVMTMTSPTHCATNAGTGLLWCEGDVMANLLPVIFTGASDAVSSISVAMTGGGTSTDSDGSDGFSVSWLKSASSAPTAKNLETPVTFTVNSVTVGGQTGPLCINPDPVLNPPYSVGGVTATCATTNANKAVFATPLRLDNLAPSVTLFDLTPATLGCAPATACYVNASFAFSVRSGFFALTDGGVGSPTATFKAGPADALLDVTTGDDLAESVTPTYVAQATVMDALGNTKTGYASTAAGFQSSATGAQLFGIDKTAPTTTIAGIADKAVNAGNTWTISYSDAGVGPSGFSLNPVRVLLEQITPAGITCYVPDELAFSATTAGCTTSSGAVNYQADDGVVEIPTSPLAGGSLMQGYWRVTYFVLDQAVNASTTKTRSSLLDVDAPVIGGISSPSSITGGSSQTFVAGLGDNVALGTLTPSLDYGAGPMTFEFPSMSMGAYDPDNLVSSATGSFPVASFIRSNEGTTAAGRSNGTVIGAQTVRFDLMDVAGNAATATTDISAAVAFGAGGTLPTLATVSATIFAPANVDHGNFVHLAPSNPTVCDASPSSGCAAGSKTSTVLSATMTGPNATFANPFTAVNFYYQDPVSLRWILIGTGAAAASDNTVTSTRTWTYSVTWTATGLVDAAGNALDLAGGTGVITIMAQGVHSSGSALISTGTPQTVTFSAT